MSDDPFKKAGLRITNVPQRLQQLVTEEPLEIPKAAKKQILNPEATITPPVSSSSSVDIQPGTPTSEEAEEIERKARKRLEELKTELEKAYQQREKSEEEWQQNQAILMNTGAKKEEKKPLIQQTSVPRRGVLPGFVKEKQSAEIAKRPIG